MIMMLMMASAHGMINLNAAQELILGNWPPATHIRHLRHQVVAVVGHHAELDEAPEL